MKISDYMSKLGKKGGKSGTGDSKRRGDSEYYKKISKIAADKRREKKYYICKDKACTDKDCKHRKPHLFDSKNCSGDGSCCPPCVPYREET